MPEPVISIDTSLIRDGSLDELKKAVAELVEFVRANEPRPIAYEVYFDQAGSRMTCRFIPTPRRWSAT
jgi:CHASE2 domain-containing sensor protein